MLDESGANSDARVEEHRKRAGMKVVREDRFGDDGGGKFGCSWMRGVSLDDDGASGGSRPAANPVLHAQCHPPGMFPPPIFMR